LHIIGCAVAQHCYNGDVRFLWENLEIWPPVKFNPLNRLSQNLSQLIRSTRGTFFLSLVKIRSRGSSRQIGEMSLSCNFIFFLRHAQRSNRLTDFDALMAQNTRNHARMCLSGFTVFNFNIWPLFTPTPKKSNFAPKNSNFKPKWWNMKLQVYQKLLNQCTWKFDTMLRTSNRVLRCNLMTSQQIRYGGRPPFWNSFIAIKKIISAADRSISMKFGVPVQISVLRTALWQSIKIL